jgi:hypothetical protein
VLHHAAPRCPAPYYALYTARFGGKNQLSYCTGDILSAGVFGQKKDMAKIPWKLLFPPKTNFGTFPHPTGTKLKAGPYVFMYIIMA